MAEDYAKATARPGYVTLAGVEYRPKKFAPRDIGDLEAFLKREFPDPRLMARDLCQGLPDAVALKIWTDLNEEAKDWPVTILSAKGNHRLMFTYEGNAVLIWVALRKNHAEVTLEKARQIAEDVDTEEISELLRAGFPEDAFVPKGQAGPTPTE